MTSQKESSGGEHIKVIILKHKTHKYKNYRFPMLVRSDRHDFLFSINNAENWMPITSRIVFKEKKKKKKKKWNEKKKEKKHGWNKKEKEEIAVKIYFLNQNCISRNFTESKTHKHGLNIMRNDDPFILFSCAQRKSANAQQQNRSDSITSMIGY